MEMEINKKVEREKNISWDYQISPLMNFITNSFVEYTGINDCSLRSISFDHIGAFIDSASARKSISSGSEINSIEATRNFSYLDNSIKLMDFSISSFLISNSSSERFDFNIHSCLCFSISNLMNSGALNFAFIDENRYDAIENGFINEKKMLLSIINPKKNLHPLGCSYIICRFFWEPQNPTNKLHPLVCGTQEGFVISILNKAYYDFFPEDVFDNNLSLTFGETSLSNSLNLPFLTFFPNSIDHFVNSCSSLEFIFESNSSLLFISSLTNSERLIHVKLEISDFNFSSTANVIDAIYITPLDFNSCSFLRSLTFSSITLLANIPTFISGNSFLNSLSSSSGIESVILLDILSFSCIYFNQSNYVCILFKLIGEEKLSKNKSSIILYGGSKNGK